MPETPKKDIFNTLDTLNLFADMTDLFTVKFTKTESEFLELMSDNKKTDLDKINNQQDTHYFEKRQYLFIDR